MCRLEKGTTETFAKWLDIELNLKVQGGSVVQKSKDVPGPIQLSKTLKIK